MIVLALISGVILGVIFFGGLWFTIKTALRTAYAPLWFLGSALIRTAIVLTGFYFVAQGSLSQLLIIGVGFLAARFLVLQLTRPLKKKQILSKDN